MTAKSHYECSLEQADGRYDLERGANNGDGTDLFRAGVNDRFSDTTSPTSKWWDGTSSGLTISQISAAAKDMTFTAD